MKILATTLRAEAKAVGLNRDTVAYLTALCELAAWSRLGVVVDVLLTCTPTESPAFDFYAKLIANLREGGAA